jgi:hypothetical protein
VCLHRGLGADELDVVGTVVALDDGCQHPEARLVHAHARAGSSFRDVGVGEPHFVHGHASDRALVPREHLLRVATVHLLELGAPAFDVRIQASAALSSEVVHDTLGVFRIALGTRKTVLSLAHAARRRLDDPLRRRLEHQWGAGCTHFRRRFLG